MEVLNSGPVPSSPTHSSINSNEEDTNKDPRISPPPEETGGSSPRCPLSTEGTQPLESLNLSSERFPSPSQQNSLEFEGRSRMSPSRGVLSQSPDAAVSSPGTGCGLEQSPIDRPSCSAEPERLPVSPDVQRSRTPEALQEHMSSAHENFPSNLGDVNSDNSVSNNPVIPYPEREEAINSESDRLAPREYREDEDSYKEFYSHPYMKGSERDRAQLSHGLQYAQDSVQYHSYDSASSSDSRAFHQSSPNPAPSCLLSQQYSSQTASMSHSPSRMSAGSEGILGSSSSSILASHRNSPFIPRGSPHLPDAAQHLHPHGSPLVHQDQSSHFAHHLSHHQNSLSMNPLSYSSGRSIDSPQNHGSPLRKETMAAQDGRYQEYMARGPLHALHQQSPSPHRTFADNMQMKDSPHHGLHDASQDPYHIAHQHPMGGPHKSAQQGPEGYWNIPHELLSTKMKVEPGCNTPATKDWFDGGSDSLLTERSLKSKTTGAYHNYPSNDSSMGDSSPLGHQQHLNTQSRQTCHSYSSQQSDQHSLQPQTHYHGYPTHGMAGNMSPMSPNYPSGQRGQVGGPIGQQSYHGSQYSNDPQQYGQMGIPQQQYPGQGCHLGGPMGPPGREGDPYSFVDEYTGPSPRPVDEVLGSQQPKRRGRKPKHIKLMENGGDPIAIAAALAAHEAKKRKKKMIERDNEMLPPNINSDPILVAAAQAAHEAKKRKLKTSIGPDGKIIPTIIKPRKKLDRFDGLTEDEVAKRVLPDHLGPNLDIVIIGINSGLFSAYKGHHYAGPGNHFWKCLFLSGLIPEPLSPDDDHQLLHYGIGFTNIVARTSRGSADLTRKEIKEGGQHLLSKLQQYQPRIAVFNGKGIYEIFSGKKEFTFGRQPEKIEGTRTHVWVMPSSSARCAQLPRALDKVPFYTALRKFRDFLKGTIDELKEEDIAFANIKIRNLKKDPEKMAALAGDSLLRGDSMVEDFMGSDMLKDRSVMPSDLGMESQIQKEFGIKSEVLSDGMSIQDVNLDVDQMRRSILGDESGRRDMIFGGEDGMTNVLNDDSIKMDLGDLSKEDEEDDDISKLTPQSLFKLNGMTRDQLESLDCPTIPIRKKRGRPKKTPDDPNMSDRPRPRPMSQQQHVMGGIGTPGGLGPPEQLMCNGMTSPMLEEMPRKKRGRPKKLLPDGSVPPPKRPGRKPKALKEMLQQQQHGPPMGHMGGMPIHESHMMNHMNGLMSPQGFSPNHGSANFSPQYGSAQSSMMSQQNLHNPQQQYMHPSQMSTMHQSSGLASNHSGGINGPLTPGSQGSTLHPGLHPASGSTTGGGRGPTPHQFGQSPGYSPSPVASQHHMSQLYPNHMSAQSDQIKHELTQVEEDQQLGLSPPPATSPGLSQTEFDSHPSISDNDLSSSEHRQAPITPNVVSNSPAPPHMEQPMLSNPSTPAEHSSSSYPPYQASYQTAHHSPAKHVPSPLGMTSGSISSKSDMTSKSLSGLESLVDQIPSISGDHHETNSQHSSHSSTHSAAQSTSCSNPTTPIPVITQQQQSSFSPGPPPYGASNTPTYSSQSAPPQAAASHYNSPQHPYSPHYSSPQQQSSYSPHYSSPQQQSSYSPHYSSNSTNATSNFSVSSLANSSHSTSISYSVPHSTTPTTSPSSTPSTSSFSVSSLTGGSPTPAPSLYSNSSYSPAPPGPSLGHSSYPDVMGSPMLAPTPPMGAPPFMSSTSLMSSGSMGSMGSMGSGSMGPMGPLHSQMTATSQLPYPYSQYGDSGPHYPSSHSTFPPYHSTGPPGFHVPSPRFPYPSPYTNSPYSQGYSQNAMLERIKHTGMGMGFSGF